MLAKWSSNHPGMLTAWVAGGFHQVSHDETAIAIHRLAVMGDLEPVVGIQHLIELRRDGRAHVE